VTIIILLSSLTVFWAKFYHKKKEKILDRGNLLCSAFLASLWTVEEEIKNICQTVTERQKISNSLSLSFFSVKSLLCCVHTTKSTEEEDGRDDEEEHCCEKQRRH